MIIMTKKLSKKGSEGNILKDIQQFSTGYPQSVDKRKFNDYEMICMEIVDYPHIHRCYCY